MHVFGGWSLEKKGAHKGGMGAVSKSGRAVCTRRELSSQEGVCRPAAGPIGPQQHLSSSQQHAIARPGTANH